MEQPPNSRIVDVEAHVRSNTGPAGFVAGLLIFFGFFWLGGPSGEGTFLVGDMICQYTLRLGGLAMVGVAIGSSIGTPVALLADAIVSLLIGVLLALSGVLMLVGGGGPLQDAIYIVCGTTFVVSSLRGWRELRALPVDGVVSEEDEDEEEEGFDDDEDHDDHASGGGQTHGAVEADPAPRPRVGKEARRPGVRRNATSEDGFLAGFAERKPPFNT